MPVSVHNFAFGALTPLLAFTVSFAGCYLGLRLTTRAMAYEGRARALWLLLAGVCIGGSGIWGMHFIAMLGWRVPGMDVTYNIPVTILSGVLAVVIVCLALLIACGPRGGSWRHLGTGGSIAGIGVAVMHYTGMGALRIAPSQIGLSSKVMTVVLCAHVTAAPGATRLTYNPLIMAVSVLIAVTAATAGLWAATRLRTVGSTFAASAVFAVAVCGMHYTGMAAVRLYASPSPAGLFAGSGGGALATSFILPLVLGIGILTVAMALVVAVSPSAAEIIEERQREDRTRRLAAELGIAERERARRRAQAASWIFTSRRPPPGD